MKRYLIALTVALMMIVLLSISRLGHFQPWEMPAQAQEKSKKEKSKEGKSKEEKPTQAQEQPKGDVVAGKALYLTNCKKCHGELGEGVPKMYRLVKATLVHLGSKQAQDKSDAEIRKSMTDGVGKMQAIKDPRPLTPAEMDNIIAFTRTLKQ